MVTVTLENYEKRHIFGNNRPIRMIFVSIIGFDKISDRLEYVSLRLGNEIMSKTGFASCGGSFLLYFACFLMVDQKRKLCISKDIGNIILYTIVSIHVCPK